MCKYLSSVKKIISEYSEKTAKERSFFRMDILGWTIVIIPLALVL